MLRSFYIDKVKELIGKPLVKVLLGMRRVGKSTLLKQICDHLIKSGINAAQTIFINFELLQYEHLKEYRALFNYLDKLMINNEKYYIFLDEIQEVKGFEKVVNSLNAEGKAELFITGSNSKLLSGELATYLTGRFYSIEIYPFSLKELSGFKPESSLLDLMMGLIRMGGMPGRFEFKNEEFAKNYLSDIYESILLRDLVERHSIRDVDLLDRFLKYVFHNTSQIFSAGSITNYLKTERRSMSRETIYNYIDACKSAFLIHGVARYNIRGKEIMRTNEKYYVNDLGLRAVFFNNERDISQSLENLVFIELLTRGYSVYTGRVEDKEVDFIIEKGSAKEYIQVAYSLSDQSTIQREFSVLENIPDNYPKTVISMDNVNFSHNGIIHKNIIDFLME